MSVWQSLLSQGAAFVVLAFVAYLFRDVLLRFVSDRLSLASRKELQSREHEFKTQFDEVRRNFERLQSAQETFLTAILEVSSERAKSVSKREMEAAEAIWASVTTLNRLLLSSKTADRLNFDAIEKLGTADRAKLQKFASFFTKEFTPEFQAKVDCEWTRLYVNDSAWAFYHAYSMILLSGSFRLMALESDVPQDIFDEAVLKEAILDALPHQKPTLEKHPTLMSSLFLDELRGALLRELKKSIRGEQATEEEAAIARAIVNTLPSELPIPKTGQA
ncbi:MAG: hypothetical protein F4213_21650 [Boseongicola sp. SB0677_bin_26]|nr:hypothetical protein [Boseongicola sp. SB0665_bin_10]MYG28586.1 hypothetical protein [Boseongicola sp. SB0677_bin_26]